MLAKATEKKFLTRDLPQGSGHRRWTLIAASIGMIMAILDVTVVNVALPSIRVQLGTSVADLAWVVDAYTLTFAALMLGAGAVADRLGAKQVFIIGLTLFVTASALCGLATGSASLIAFRALQGVGAALFLPSSLAVVSQTFPEPTERARAVGIWGGLAATASAAGPVIGGFLVDSLGWRSVFLINVPIGIAGILLAIRVIRTPTFGKSRAMDPVGQALAVMALGLLSYGIIEGPVHGWGAPTVLGALVLGLSAVGIFVIVERRVAQPMVSFELFANGNFSAAMAVGFLMNLAFYGAVFLLSLYLQTSWHYSALETGIALLPLAGVLAVGNVIAGRLVERLGTRRQMALGLSIAVAGFAVLCAVIARDSYPLLGAAMVITGIGTALTVAPMTTTVLEHAPESLSGTASAMLNVIRQIGSLLGVAAIGALLADLPGYDLAAQVAMAGAGLCYATAVIAVLLVTRPQRPRQLLTTP